LFKQVCAAGRGGGGEGGFNLLSEILFVQALIATSRRQWNQSFNLLSEILFVQASIAPDTSKQYQPFQSLERDSVCSSCSRCRPACQLALFQSLERDSVCSSFDSRPCNSQHHIRFNLLSEILFVQAKEEITCSRRS